MVHGNIKPWVQVKVTYNGGGPKFIRTDHKSDNNYDKPLECGVSGKAGLKVV